MDKRVSERSFEKIEKADLKRLLDFAIEDREDFFDRHPRWKKLCSGRILCIALCQGAAQHYVDGKNGVKDFDVWTFYAEHPEGQYPYRRVGHKDYGVSKFGVHPLDMKKFQGRCVDLIGRSLKTSPKTNPVKAVWQYLWEAKTKTAVALSKKAVVLLYPQEMFGKVIWPAKM